MSCNGEKAHQKGVNPSLCVFSSLWMTMAYNTGNGVVWDFG